MSVTWARRPRLVAGNWKMHKTANEATALAGELCALLTTPSRTRIAVFPPFTALAAVGAPTGGPLLGGQDLHPEDSGAFTGSISGPMLKSLGCSIVIVGHSERRHGVGEDDALVARKLRAALRSGLTPIVCVGETRAEREGGKTADVLVRQIRGAFDGLGAASTHACVIAYEPVWAIGTGLVATPEQAAEAHGIVRATLDRVVEPAVGEAVAILYGGSVNPQNAPALFALDAIDGALVGGASLEAASFWRIIAAA